MMRATRTWPANTRIIEVGTSDGALGQRLVTCGFHNYLAVVRDEQRCQTIARQYPAIGEQIVAALPTNTISQNNAEVLILDGGAALAIGRIRWVRHAHSVALRLKLTPVCCLALLLALANTLFYRFAWPQLVDCGRLGNGPWLAVFRVRKRRPHNSVRRFIPHRLGISGFLGRLGKTGVQHAVLRWFENLPALPPGEDLDLLIDDTSLQTVRFLSESGPGIQPIDLYSVTGLPGADFRSMPYYPPYLAEELLNRAVKQSGLCSVPAPREYFLSLAYHALYHKGAASGLPIDAHARPIRSTAGHDYATILAKVAAAAGVEAAITLNDLDDYLDSQGWRPPHDMLIRLAKRNRWLRNRLRETEKTSSADDRLAVFLVREAALARGGLSRAAQLIESLGFQILATRTFDGHNLATLARSLRGGNWGQGPWPISGGPPVAAIVAYDPAPIAPTRRDKKRFPFIANARLLSKEKLRDAFNQGFGKDQHCNVIHSSDNGREAMDYLRIIMPDAIDDVLRRTQPAAVLRAA